MKERSALMENSIDPRLILMSAWAAMLCLYLYCDFFTLFRPGQLEVMSGGKMGPFAVSQAGLFWAGVLMAIPSLMILVSTLAPAGVNRILNMVSGAVYFVVNIGNLIGETWAYYYLFGLLEVGLAILIFFIALRRFRPAP